MIAPRLFPQLPQARQAATPVVFNPRSLDLLSGVDPLLAELMRRVEAKHPDAFEISEGMRSKDRQAKMVAEGKSQTMNSKHLTGNAVDIAMAGPDGKPNWDFESYMPIAETAKAEAAAMGIPNFVWGGDWKTLKDGVHFQVGGPGVNPEAPMTSGEKLTFGTPQQPGLLPPLSMGTTIEVTQPTIWDKMTEALKVAEENKPAPMQLAPVQRTPYTQQQIDRVAPYLKFFQSVS